MNTFDNLLADKNYLGAFIHIKEQKLPREEEGIALGNLSMHLVKEIDACRLRNEKEQITYLKSVLAYCLRDFPGLSALYREQQFSGLRQSGIVEQVGQASRNLNDVLSGKISVEAGIKEGIDQIEKHAEEAGVPVGDLAREIEKGVKSGINGVADFLSALGTLTASPKTDSPAEEASQEHPQAEADGEVFKVHIEGKDTPLPDSIKDAETSSKGSKKH